MNFNKSISTLFTDRSKSTLSLKKTNKTNTPKPKENHKSSKMSAFKSLLRPKKWFSHDQRLSTPVQQDEMCNDSEITMVDAHSEFEGLLEYAYEEIKYALDSYESCYYEGDLVSTQEALDKCLVYHAQMKLSLVANPESKYFLDIWNGKIKDLQSEINELPAATASD
ncbi:hypothetical protein BD408DRAFT_120951 [Parasitella parasitica]|nr:hypothetical protein BD408DRAFT_120951 [Parasitella parasitica]